MAAQDHSRLRRRAPIDMDDAPGDLPERGVVEPLSLADAARTYRALGTLGRKILPYLEQARDVVCTPVGRRTVIKSLDYVCATQAKSRVSRKALRVEPKLVERLATTIERSPCGCGVSPAQQKRAVEYLHALSQTIEPVPIGGGETIYSGEMGVDAAAMWQMMTQDLYGDNDLVALAVREALQNSSDAVNTAQRSRGEHGITPGEGYFAVTWEEDEGGETGTLTFEDNGVGMNQDILINKFLVLGATGKGEDVESVGGFGVAKAVILGVTPTGRWEVHTRDLGAKPIPGSMSYDVYRMPYRQGTKIVCYDVPTKDMYSRVFSAWYAVEQRIKAILAFSDTGRIDLLYNGLPVTTSFPRRRGFHLKYADLDWGDGNEVTVKRYRRTAGTGSGNFYVRLVTGSGVGESSLIQFTEGPGGDTIMKSDIVIDIRTTNRPRDTEYPLNASRDRFKSASSASWAFRQLKETFIRESASADEDREYDTLLPDSSDPKERKGAEQFGAAMRKVMEDDDFKAMYDEVMGVASEFYEEQQEVKQEPDVSKGERQVPVPGEKKPDPYAGWRQVQRAIPKTAEEADTTEGRRKLGEAIEVVLTDIEGGKPGQLVWGDTKDALTSLQAGGSINDWQAKALLDAFDKAPDIQAKDKDQVGTSNVATSMTLSELGKRVSDLVQRNPAVPAYVKEEVKKKASKVNPFGTAGAVKISRQNYDKRKARRFLKKAAKYIPMLVLWDITLRMIAQEGGVQIPFRPGFVLDDTVRGVCASEGEAGSYEFRNYVMVHPDRLKETVKAHKNHPNAIATYLHTVACHEIAHLPRIGQGHNESFVVAREDLAFGTAHLLPAIEKAVVKTLKLDPKPSKALRKKLNAARREGRKQGRDQYRDKVKKLRKQLRELEADAAKDDRDVDKLLDEYEDIRQDRDRLKRIVESRQEATGALVARLNALVDYHDFRAWLKQSGTPFLPEGTSALDFLDWLDQHPRMAADAFLETSGVEQLRVQMRTDPRMPEEYQKIIEEGGQKSTLTHKFIPDLQ